jgi:putative flippase GtrA
MAKNKQRKDLVQLFYEFIKLQLAGNIPFWGTYIINFGLDKGLQVNPFQSLLVATVLANALFFVVDDRWVFKRSRNKRKTGDEIWRFVIFMSLSALLTFNITWLLYTQFGISTYIGQFISAALSIMWTFIGLRFWVFAPSKKSKTRSRKMARRA